MAEAAAEAAAAAGGCTGTWGSCTWPADRCEAGAPDWPTARLPSTALSLERRQQQQTKAMAHQLKKMTKLS